jgi:perosamine synthetase
MNIKNNISLDSLLVTLPVTFEDVLKAIQENAFGTVFFVNNDRQLIGIFTDGDARRALLAGATLSSLITEQSNYFNKFPRSLLFNCDLSAIWSLLEQNLRCIPLLDTSNRIVDFSTRERIRKFPVLEPDIGEQEISNVLECVTSGWISSQGRFIGEFERVFSAYMGGGYAIAVANGTVALQLGLTTLGIGRGDEVIVPNFTFGASINAIIHAGATPVLADVDQETWTLNLDEICKLITPQTKAIMPVHLYGQPARIDEIKAIASKNGIFVIEDCAEALGATYKTRRVGLDGDCSCFSFFANKTITTGEGGMVVFKDARMAERARILRDHGMSPQKRYWHEYPGFNFRMTNMQAAVGVAQMDRIEEFIKRRKIVFKTYDGMLDGRHNISLLPKNKWSENSYWLYTIVLNGYEDDTRDQLIIQLGYRGIDARPGFYPMHLMNPYREFANGTYPVSSYLSANSISLPSSPRLSNKEIRHIVEIFLEELANSSENVKEK